MEKLNDVMQAIRTRRTVKRFDSTRLPTREQVEQVIEAATWAPNHHSTEPWRFIVFSGRARERLGDALAGALQSSSSTPVQPERLEAEKAKSLSAPYIVALVSSPRAGENIVPQEELIAAGAALQNMLLAAQSLGLASSVRTGRHAYSSEMKAFLGLRDEEVLVGFVYLGYSEGRLPPGVRTSSREKVSWLED